MITQDKLEYLLETKQEIKETLNYWFNTEISESDTFRSYVLKINQLFAEYPTQEN